MSSSDSLLVRLAGSAADDNGLARVETGIAGFDHVAMGGLPRGRATVVAGGPGSAKTVFAGAFLAEGVRRGEPGVYVTLEEPADDLRRNFGTLGWEVPEWEASDLWRFVDASPLVAEDEVIVGGVDTLLARIGQEADRTAADRLVVDSLNTMFLPPTEPAVARQYIRELVAGLRRMGLTVLLTMETNFHNETAVAAPGGFGIEEFVADNVVLLRNRLEDEKRRRTVEILKMRGAMHRKGEYPFTVLPGRGPVVIPLSTISLTQSSSRSRISSGNAALDEMCGGGFFKDSIVLASGATGTGKTLMVTEFLGGGAAAGERCLLLAYEESRDQLFRNAAGWGQDFASLEAAGTLRIVATYPEVASLEDHLVEIKREIDTFRPDRLAIDSLSALERIGSGRAFREFIIGLTSFLKAEEVAALLTATTPSLLGGQSVTEAHISTLTDSIILLRYVELTGRVRRGITVLKMRGSDHDRDIREFTIAGDGMSVGDPFRGVSGILSGRVNSGEGDVV